MVHKATHRLAGINPLLVTGVKSFIRIFQEGDKSVRVGEGDIEDYPFSEGVLQVRERRDARMDTATDALQQATRFVITQNGYKLIAKFSEHRENFQRCVRHFVNAAVKFSFGNHPENDPLSFCIFARGYIQWIHTVGRVVSACQVAM